jgi:NAD(P)-dependent dehydrogenase (short-subunit alcohol dehydrogenase family)
MNDEDTISAWRGAPADLTGAMALVVGGAGGVGEGVVRSLLNANASVVVGGRDQGRLDDFTDRMRADSVDGADCADVSRLSTVVLDGLSPDLEATVQSMVAHHGRFNLVVVSVASWGDQGRKPLLTFSDEEWDALVAGNQTVVFRLYRALVPVLSPTGALIQLNGMSADIPFPGAAGVALTAAATKSLTQTLAAEVSGQGLRVYELVLGVIRTRARQLAGIDDKRWIDATQIGEHIAELTAGVSPLTGTVLQYFVDKVAGPLATPPKN